MTLIEMEIAIANYFNYRRNIIVPNVSWGLNLYHECDILVMTKKGYCTEIEIKRSRSDLKKDQKKWHNHRSNKIKYLYFAVPKELEKIALEVIPQRAGLLVLRYYEDRIVVDLSRKPIQNKEARPLDYDEQLHLAHLGCMRIFNLKSKLSRRLL